jgi:hypothetical protein
MTSPILLRAQQQVTSLSEPVGRVPSSNARRATRKFTRVHQNGCLAMEPTLNDTMGTTNADAIGGLVSSSSDQAPGEW